VSEEAKGRASRRLAAILVASLAPLSPGDERGSLARLRSCLAEIIVPLISQFDGSVFKQTGDVVLSEFGSVVEAARCASALREAVARHNQSLPNEQRIAMRIGINLGDVIAESATFSGTASISRRGSGHSPNPAAFWSPERSITSPIRWISNSRTSGADS